MRVCGHDVMLTSVPREKMDAPCWTSDAFSDGCARSWMVDYMYLTLGVEAKVARTGVKE